MDLFTLSTNKQKYCNKTYIHNWSLQPYISIKQGLGSKQATTKCSIKNMWINKQTGNKKTASNLLTFMEITQRQRQSPSSAFWLFLSFN